MVVSSSVFIYQILGWSYESGSDMGMTLEENVSAPLLREVGYAHLNKVFALNNMDITQDISTKVDGQCSSSMKPGEVGSRAEVLLVQPFLLLVLIPPVFLRPPSPNVVVVWLYYSVCLPDLCHASGSGAVSLAAFLGTRLLRSIPTVMSEMPAA